MHRRFSTLLFLTNTLSMMLFILSACIAIPFLVRPFYYAHIALLDLPQKTGWSGAQIQRAFNEMMDYCLFGGTFSTGDLCWSESGLAHFNDCAVLFRLDLIVLLFSAAVLLLCHFLRRRGLCSVAPLGYNSAFWAGSILAIAFLILSILAATNFNRAFVLFHALFFPGKDNWIFNPATDEIILILPQVFFRNCAILIVGTLLFCCVVLILRNRKKINK